jgi:hypothetical protein
MLVIQRVEEVVEALQKSMDKITLKWKDSDATDEYCEAKPTVYAFTYDDLTDNLPIKTPSVLVQFMGLSDSGIASFLVHVCVCNPALQDKEITTPSKENPDLYVYGTGDDISSSHIRSELYKSCLMLGEQVYLTLKRMGNCKQSISNVELDPPSPYLDKFPYCECCVSFESEIVQTSMFDKIDTDVIKYL